MKIHAKRRKFFKFLTKSTWCASRGTTVNYNPQISMEEFTVTLSKKPKLADQNKM